MNNMLDPRICNIHLDANALDRDGSNRDALVNRLFALEAAEEVTLVVPDSVRREAAHPSTPVDVKTNFSTAIFTLGVDRTPEEMALLERIRTILRGNSKPGKHDADSEHIFEASKYGGGYFITHDQRIYKKSAELRNALGSALAIVQLQEFLEIYDRFVMGDSP